MLLIEMQNFFAAKHLYSRYNRCEHKLYQFYLYKISYLPVKENLWNYVCFYVLTSFAHELQITSTKYRHL